MTMEMSDKRARWYFAFFLGSGLCSLVYEVIWLRLAMSRFGVTTALVSLMLSVYMAGLALGSWGAGWLSRALAGRPERSFLRLYGVAELVIGSSVLVVPPALSLGHRVLARPSGELAWGSASYHAAAGGWLALSLLPFCTCMGATFPLAMSAFRRGAEGESQRSFSYLYLANVIGAAAGTIVSAFVLIELLGFRGTLVVTAILNVLVAAAAFRLSLRAGSQGGKAASAPPARRARDGAPGPWPLLLLFTTGLVSMASEIVWVRQFTPYQGTLVYSFATILGLYLITTAAGSWLYRSRFRALSEGTGRAGTGLLWVLAGGAALLPLLAADPRLPLLHGPIPGAVRLALGLGAFCALTGMLTPLLVDRWSRGDGALAGRAYAVNVLGCILGPLLSGFVLLPSMGEKRTLLVLSLPLFAIGLSTPSVEGNRRAASGGLRFMATTAAIAGAVLLLIFTRDFESVFPRREVRRDHTATIVAAGEGMEKLLLVNGVGITSMTPITKMMAHLPLSLLPRAPQDAIALCFGMGTSFRSLLSWGIPTTGVELVPSVPSVFGYFHADGPDLLRSPAASVVIDDARRYMERTARQYDVITIDPPPPVEAAGSSLLYSVEFYALLNRRLRPGGIVAQWIPAGDAYTLSAMAKAFAESFPHVRVFQSVEGWGFHLLGSRSPIPVPSASALASKLPPRAVGDLLEWGPFPSAERQFRAVLDREMPVADLIALAPGAPALSDDRPVNEYYLLRTLLPSSGQGSRPGP